MKRFMVGVRHPSFPFVVMLGFTLLLLAALLGRVYLADRDMALGRVARIQASLAAEAGIHFAVQRIQQALVKSSRLFGGHPIHARELAAFLPMGKWVRMGGKTNAFFRVIQMEKVSGVDRKETPLLDETGLFRIVSEGRTGPAHFRATGVIGLVSLMSRYAVVNSLNEHYYGIPIQPMVAESGGLEAFLEANAAFVKAGDLTSRGVITSPALLHQVFRAEGDSPFTSPVSGQKPHSTYGSAFARGGNSPCYGPLYCQTPIVVDTHTFWGPIQTGSYLYRRGSGKPKIQFGQSVVAVPSSRRVQLAADALEGELPEGVCVDRDTHPARIAVPQWAPDFAALRQLAKTQGIYVDAKGKGFNRGEAVETDFHFGTQELFSESYREPTSPGYVRDERNEGCIVLSTETRFDDRNNLSAKALKGARVLFSENSIHLRGDIGGDLVIVTPKTIFLTGSTNVDLPFNLFLVGGEGVAISTIDLEQFLTAKSPTPEVAQAARHWIINAILYKPGAGWYGSWSRPSVNEGKAVPIGLGGNLSMTIIGGTIQGNLQRWIEFSGVDGIQVKWNPQAVARLPFVPMAANLLRLRTVSAH